MRDALLAGLLLIACGPGSRGQVDARGEDSSTTKPPDAAIDAAAVACTERVYVPTTGAPPPGMTFTFVGGSTASFGCAPIDPTYWMSGAGMSVTVSFATPQPDPAIRVWGMNTDDTAQIEVDGAVFPLTATSATLAPKVVCGQSPGPDGVEFVDGGKLAGANTPSEGNYSYQDVTLHGTISTIRVTGLTGAGWGFVGASVCSEGPVLE